MQGKRVLVTGATSGIGRETAKALARMGAAVVTASRNVPAQQELRQAILREIPGAEIEDAYLDLSSLDSIRAFAAEFLSGPGRLDVLVNNAGIFRMRRELTTDGFEATIGVNFLGPLLLTHLLLPQLRDTPGARIVNVSSDACLHARLDLGNLHLERGYRGFRAYAASKLAILLFTLELADRLSPDGPTANAVHPGHVATGIWSGRGPLMGIARWVARRVAISPEEGTRTTTYLASSPKLAAITGRYFADSAEKPLPAAAHDRTLRTSLWDLATASVGIEEQTWSSS